MKPVFLLWALVAKRKRVGAALLAGLLLSCWALSVKAQIPQQPLNVLTPNAASFQLFGDVPVSLYTGTANIGVSLYTLQEGPISVPVSLDYHASGFRPDQHPGWVGLGWNLNAGGVVNRAVRDLPDEYDDPTTGGYALQRGYYFTHSYLDVSNWDSPTRIRALCNEQDRGVPKYTGDTEPDEFSFSFMGYSGKFYLDHKGEWQVQSNKPLKVQLLNPSNPFVLVPIARPGYASTGGPYPKAYGGFSILTEDGTQYIFGGTSTSVEYSIPFYAQAVAPWFADSWELTRIVAPDGHQVTFTYERETTFINQMYIAFDQSTYNNQADDGTFLGTFHCSSYGSALPAIPEAYYRGKLLSPVYLASIQGTTTKLTFTRGNTTELTYAIPVYDYYYRYIWDKQHEFLPYLEDPAGGAVRFGGNAQAVLDRMKWKQLNRVDITQQNSQQRGFTFSYSGSTIERLTLQQVREIGVGGVLKPPYKFDYYPYSYTYNGTVVNQQAQYLSNRTDHWGFFNDTYAPLDDLANYYNNRAPSATPAVYLSGLLKRITYPTAGVTDFTYEPHAYGKQLALNRQAPATTSPTKQAGGVRIRKITSYTPGDPASKLEKEYFYVTDYTAAASAATLAGLPSTGVLGGQIQYAFNYTLKSFTDNSTVTYNIFSSQSVLPASLNSQGCHIGYGQVVEKRSDNSYTKFSFSNFDTESGHPDEQGTVLQPTRTAYEPYSYREQERGSPTREEMYTAADKCVKRHQTDYVAFQKGTEGSFVRAVKVQLIGICSGSEQSLEEGTAYRLYTYAYLPVQETETIYDADGNNPYTTTTTHSYDPSKLVASTATTDSKGQAMAISYTYPFNLGYPFGAATPPTDPEANAIYSMAARNMLSYPIETITTRNGQVSAVQVQTYKWAGMGNAYILPYKTYSLENAQPLAAYTPSAYNGSSASGPFVVGGNNAQLRLKTTWFQFDSQSNPVGLLKDGNLASTYQWGYNKTLLVAKAENALPNEVFTENFEEQQAGWDGGLSYENMPYYGGTGYRAAYTGQLVGRLSSYNRGDQYHSFSNAPLTIALAAPKKFVLSGWVYSEGPLAQLWLFMYQPGETGYFTQVDYVSLNPADVGKWVYLQKEITVPQNIVKLNCRLTNFCSSASAGPGRVWFDDVRIYPADAQLTTYTHKPGTGVTSVSDANNRPVLYEYDGLNRLFLTRDHENNILRSLEYNYHP